MRTRWAALVLAVAAAACGRARSDQAPASPPPAEPVTFNRQVAPIVYRNCAPCHRPGEAGPFSLLSYADVRKRADQIARVTASRYMPPWPPAPGYGEFVGERRLRDDEIALLQRWFREGAPEGAPSDAPPPPHFTEGWQLGPPDLVVEMRETYTVPAEGGDVFRNFVLPVPVKGTHYVRALELRQVDADRLLDHERRGTGCRRRRRERVAVVVCPAQAEEEGTRLHRARVVGEVGDV